MAGAKESSKLQKKCVGVEREVTVLHAPGAYAAILPGSVRCDEEIITMGTAWSKSGSSRNGNANIDSRDSYSCSSSIKTS